MVHVAHFPRMLCLLRRGVVQLRSHALLVRGGSCRPARHSVHASPVPQLDALAFAIEREARHSQFPPQGGKVGLTALHLASRVLRPASSRRDTQYPFVGRLLPYRIAPYNSSPRYRANRFVPGRDLHPPVSVATMAHLSLSPPCDLYSPSIAYRLTRLQEGDVRCALCRRWVRWMGRDQQAWAGRTRWSLVGDGHSLSEVTDRCNRWHGIGRRPR